MVSRLDDWRVADGGSSRECARKRYDAAPGGDAYMAAWNAHDVDAAAALLADDVTYFDATVGHPEKGRDAARDKVIKLFVTAAPDLT